VTLETKGKERAKYHDRKGNIKKTISDLLHQRGIHVEKQNMGPRWKNRVDVGIKTLGKKVRGTKRGGGSVAKRRVV